MCAWRRDTVPFASSAPSSNTMSFRRVMRWSASVNSARRPMFTRGLSSRYSGRSAFPFTTTSAPRSGEPARRGRGALPYSMSNGWSPSSDVATSTTKPRGISQPEPFSASRTSSSRRSPNALCRISRRSASGETSVTTTRENGKMRSPRAIVCTLLWISSRIARCTITRSSDCARSEHALRPTAEPALDGSLDLGKQAHWPNQPQLHGGIHDLRCRGRGGRAAVHSILHQDGKCDLARARRHTARSR